MIDLINFDIYVSVCLGVRVCVNWPFVILPPTHDNPTPSPHATIY